MKRLTAIRKAEELFKNENVFQLSETPNYEYWAVKGISREKYDVIYHKAKDIYTCNCRNMRFVDCSHILAVKMEKGEIDGTEISYKRNSVELPIQG